MFDAASATSGEHWIGVSEHLEKMVRIPEALLKTHKRSRIACKLSWVGWHKITTSSA